MRKLSLFCILLLLCGCGGVTRIGSSPPPTAPYTFPWKDNGNPGVPNCTTASATWCLTSYTLRENGVVIMTGIAPTAKSVTLPATSGTHTYELSVVGVEGSPGVTKESPYLTQTVNVP